MRVEADSQSKPERDQKCTTEMATGRGDLGGHLAAKKTMRITIETERLLVIRHGASARVWCEQCASEVETVPLEIAAELAQVDVKAIQHLLDHEKLHLSQPGGPVGICLKSLLKKVV